MCSTFRIWLLGRLFFASRRIGLGSRIGRLARAWRRRSRWRTWLRVCRSRFWRLGGSRLALRRTMGNGGRSKHDYICYIQIVTPCFIKPTPQLSQLCDPPLSTSVPLNRRIEIRFAVIHFCGFYSVFLFFSHSIIVYERLYSVVLFSSVYILKKWCSSSLNFSDIDYML